MGKWIIDNWQGLVGGGSLTTIIGFIANKSNNKADLLSKFEGIYSNLADNLIEERANFKLERESFKEEVREIKKDLQTLRADNRFLKEEFKTIQLAYSKEVEISKNWEKMHNELTDKYDKLKVFCDKLKLELDKYKKIKNGI